MTKNKKHNCFHPLCECLNAKWNPNSTKSIFEEKQYCLKNGRIYKNKKKIKKQQTNKKDLTENLGT